MVIYEENIIAQDKKSDDWGTPGRQNLTTQIINRGRGGAPLGSHRSQESIEKQKMALAASRSKKKGRWI